MSKHTSHRMGMVPISIHRSLSKVYRLLVRAGTSLYKNVKILQQSLSQANKQQRGGIGCDFCSSTNVTRECHHTSWFAHQLVLEWLGLLKKGSSEVEANVMVYRHVASFGGPLDRVSLVEYEKAVKTLAVWGIDIVIGPNTPQQPAPPPADTTQQRACNLQHLLAKAMLKQSQQRLVPGLGTTITLPVYMKEYSPYSIRPSLSGMSRMP